MANAAPCRKGNGSGVNDGERQLLHLYVEVSEGKHLLLH